MKSFKQYITENYETAFEKARQIADYLDGNRKKSYLEGLAVLEAGYKAKEIYNTKYTDAYSYGFSRGLEQAYGVLWNKYSVELKDKLSQEDKWTLWSLNPQGIAKYTRIVQKLGNVLPKEFADFANAVKDMPAALKELKTYIKKGREPKPVDPNKFVKPMAPYEAQKTAVKFLQEAVDSFKKEYEASIRKTLTEQYNRIKDLTDPKDFKKLGQSDQNFASIFFMRDGYKLDSPFKLEPEPEQRLEKLIQETVEDVIGHFVAKNTSKLALIFAKKSEIVKHEILKTRIQGGMLENDMSFAFSDGSSFIITSQVIYKTSQTGKWFMQYPTRFTNVIMADGSRMSSPNEEKMISTF